MQSIAIKERNFTSKSDLREPPSTHIKSYCFTDSKKTLVTFEELRDCDGRHKNILVSSLKFWTSAAGDNEYQLTHLVHDPKTYSEKPLMLTTLSNSLILCSNGPQISVYRQYQPGYWGLYNIFSYQDLDVLQMITNVKLRSQPGTQAVKYLSLLHMNGVISYWNQETMDFSHSIVLNKPAKKIVYESSFRYLAALSEQGGVEVWKLKKRQGEEKHWWDLGFKSVNDIMNNQHKEN